MAENMGQPVAVITGASRGIGRAIALALASQGYALAIGARDEGGLSLLSQELLAKGAPVATLSVNLRDADGPARLVDLAIEQFGQLDLLVNNAGDTRYGDFLKLADQDFIDGFSLKYFSAMRASKAAWPYLMANKGTIINVVGTSGRVPGADFAIGASVNAAVLALTKSLADKGVSEGVRVMAVNPGPVMTDRLAEASKIWAEQGGVTPEDAVQNYAEKSGITRVGTPEDIAALVGFLASPAASLMTGAIIDIDGGMVKGL